MKGLVFTEFLELVERTHSSDLVDELIEKCPLASGGAYTAVGTYDHREMVALVSALAVHNRQSPSAVLRWFGLNLFSSLAQSFPVFLEGRTCAFDMLSGIETVIHTEVRKLYPDADLPGFDLSWPDEHTLVLDYRSPRCMDDLAHGLIEGCIGHFDESVGLSRQPLGRTPADGTRFTLVRQ
jgi:hypothetical protein